MSGPTCNTCGYYKQALLSKNKGECLDPTKIISSRYGQRLTEHPAVRTDSTCPNYTERNNTDVTISEQPKNTTTIESEQK